MLFDLQDFPLESQHLDEKNEIKLQVFQNNKNLTNCIGELEQEGHFSQHFQHINDWRKKMSSYTSMVLNGVETSHLSRYKDSQNLTGLRMLMEASIKQMCFINFWKKTGTTNALEESIIIILLIVIRLRVLKHILLIDKSVRHVLHILKVVLELLEDE